MILEGVYIKSLSENISLYRAPKPFYSVFEGKQEEFRASGTSLPSFPFINFRFHGSWKNDVFLVDEVEEIQPETEQEVLDFLVHRCKIDKRTALRLVFVYHEKALWMLEKDPEEVYENAGLKQWQKNSLKKSWLHYRFEEAYQYLTPFGITDRQVMRLIDRFDHTVLNAVKTKPYDLPDMCGVPFRVADAIAISNSVPWYSEMRISAALVAALKMFEDGDASGENTFSSFCREYRIPQISGNTCMEKENVFSLTKNLLGKENIITQDILEKSLDEATNKGAVIMYEDGLLSRRDTALQEKRTAENIHRLMKDRRGNIIVTSEEMESMSDTIVSKAGLAGPLSSEQADAVRLALANPFTIITGGPGTGKTTIQSAILYLMEKYVPHANIRMLAPTGRAASRMEESSGYPASTIHSALGLDVDGIGESASIGCDLIIIDEFSMVDAYLADKLFAAIKSGTKVICIGDINQLPSVGPGVVLREMIDSSVVPTAKLNCVFRQKKGSSIAGNAYKINDGNPDLEFDDSFAFEEMPENQISDYVVSAFISEADDCGIDNVCVLTPFRKKTDTGTDELNVKIQKRIHEGYEGPTLSHFSNKYMIGDKVMYRKNRNGLTNGDVGYVESIEDDCLDLAFGQKKIRLTKDDLNDITLAYAVTIHKSQGSEYKSVILVIDEKHRRMLKKALVYTAVTRAKGKLLAVGCLKALKNSVHEEDTILRKSALSRLLKNY